jgi:PAS domain-containing protein
MVDIVQIDQLLTQTGLGLTSVFEILPDMVFVVDHDEHILFVNQVAARALGAKARRSGGAQAERTLSAPICLHATAWPSNTSSARVKPWSRKISRICTSGRSGSTRA